MELLYRYPKEERERQAQQRCDLLNSEKRPAGDYDCPLCKNRGYIAFPDGETVRIRDCECMERARMKRKLAMSGLEERFRRNSFQNFEVWSPWARTMKDGVLNWSKDGKGWLLLCGQSGSGKTHLALAACGYRLMKRGQKVDSLTWREYVADQMADRGGQKQRADLERKKTVELLLIDDLFKTSRSRKEVMPWEVEFLFELINYRYNKGLDTVITTEYTTEKLLDIDEATASRILEMAGKYVFTVVPDRQKNYRLKKLPV